jgi:methylated-DNA-protein-cysteine methyltransferase-like protein
MDLQRPARFRPTEFAKAMNDFTTSVVEIIKGIPRGKVCTYGLIGLLAGQPNGARQVTRVLHSMSRKHDLPWHRVINARGRIGLPKRNGYDEQKARLEHEGVVFDEKDRVDLEQFLWEGPVPGNKPSQ